MTDFRKLCAELINVWDSAIDQDLLDMHEAVERASAALSEPAPEGPTDEQLDDLFIEIDQTGSPESWRPYARAVLARWGNRQGILDSSTPQPVPVSERLPGMEDCDAEGRCWWFTPTQSWPCFYLMKLDSPLALQVAAHWLPAHALPVFQQSTTPNEDVN